MPINDMAVVASILSQSSQRNLPDHLALKRSQGSTILTD